MPPGKYLAIFEDISVVTPAWGWGVTGTFGVEVSSAAKYPTPQQRVIQSKMSITPRLRTCGLEKLSHGVHQEIGI